MSQRHESNKEDQQVQRSIARIVERHEPQRSSNFVRIPRSFSAQTVTPSQTAASFLKLREKSEAWKECLTISKRQPRSHLDLWLRP